MTDFTKIAWYCLRNAIRHPRTPIENIVGNPVPVPRQSPIPWWGSAALILLGIISWCFGAHFGISGLDEAARAMVYIPLGNIFGMSMAIRGG